MAKTKRKLILLEFGPRREGKSKKLAAEVKKIAEVTGRKAQRAAAKVEREAYTFAPDDMLAIAIDYKNQRIMVKQVTGDPLPHDVVHKLDVLIRHAMVVGRMKRGWGLGRDCEHPRSRIRRKRYCVGTELGVMCFRMAEFCTCCGKILSHVDETLKATLAEMIAAKVANPQPPTVTRIRPMIEALKAKHNRRRA